MSFKKRIVFIFVQLVIFASYLHSVYGDSDLKPVHLGCYLTWGKNNLELANTFSKLIGDEARDSCSDWCAKQVRLVN